MVYLLKILVFMMAAIPMFAGLESSLQSLGWLENYPYIKLVLNVGASFVAGLAALPITPHIEAWLEKISFPMRRSTVQSIMVTPSPKPPPKAIPKQQNYSTFWEWVVNSIYWPALFTVTGFTSGYFVLDDFIVFVSSSTVPWEVIAFVSLVFYVHFIAFIIFLGVIKNKSEVLTMGVIGLGGGSGLVIGQIYSTSILSFLLIFGNSAVLIAFVIYMGLDFFIFLGSVMDLRSNSQKEQLALSSLKWFLGSYIVLVGLFAFNGWQYLIGF